VRKDFKLWLFSRRTDLFDGCDLSRFGTILKMAKNASALTLPDVKNLPVERVHVCVDVVTKFASDVRGNALD